MSRKEIYPGAVQFMLEIACGRAAGTFSKDRTPIHGMATSIPVLSESINAAGLLPAFGFCRHGQKSSMMQILVSAFAGIRAAPRLGFLRMKPTSKVRRMCAADDSSYL